MRGSSAKSGRSVYWDSLAAGAPRCTAVQMTEDLGMPLPKGVAPCTTKHSSEKK